MPLVATDFYPRPPGGGRPPPLLWRGAQKGISIHALWVEGDLFIHSVEQDYDTISIHALRVEGDIELPEHVHDGFYNFYPRPPGGGRLYRVSIT